MSDHCPTCDHFKAGALSVESEKDSQTVFSLLRKFPLTEEILNFLIVLKKYFKEIKFLRNLKGISGFFQSDLFIRTFVLHDNKMKTR